MLLESINLPDIENISSICRCALKWVPTNNLLGFYQRLPLKLRGEVELHFRIILDHLVEHPL